MLRRQSRVLETGMSVAFINVSVNAPELYSLMESSDGKNLPGEHEGHLLCLSLRVKGQRPGPNISPLAGSTMECLAWRYDRLTTKRKDYRD